MTTAKSVTSLTRFALLPYGAALPEWLSAAPFDAAVEFPPDSDPVENLDALARDERGSFFVVRASTRALAAAYRRVLGLEPDTPEPRTVSVLVLDWPDPCGETDARPAVVGVNLDWLPARTLGGGRDCFPSGPSGSGTAASI